MNALIGWCGQMTIAELEGRSFTIHDLAAVDLTERKLRHLVKLGAATRLAAGAYLLTVDTDDEAQATRHLHTIWRRWQRTSYAKAVVSHVSAAALWGLPLPNPLPTQVHLSGYKKTSAHSSDMLVRHAIDVPMEQVIERYGMPCTSLGRTLIDVAMTESVETAVMCADAALRLAVEVEVRANRLNPHACYAPEVAMFKAQLHQLLSERRGRRGIRRAREIVEFAEWQAESPGESILRWRMHVAGIDKPELQVPVPSPSGSNYRLDALVRSKGTFIEFDGLSKYSTSPAVARQEIIDEKRREDYIRATTGWRCVRLTWRDISSDWRFQAAMRRHGLI